MSMTVTGTWSGEFNDGCFLDVHVLTGAAAAASQTGATAQASTNPGGTLSITTTTTGSRVFGIHYDEGGANDPTGHMSSGTTLLSTEVFTANTITYATYWQAVTGTPGAVTVGYTNASANGATTLVEILASGTIAIDASGPSPAWNDPQTGNSSTSASFTPAPGSLLIALISADSDSGAVSPAFTISDTMGLTWHKLVMNTAPSTDGYTAIFVADVPGTATAVQASTQQLIPPGYKSPMAWHGFHRAPSRAAPIALFTDNFAVNDFSQQWQGNYGTTGWSAGQATYQCNTSLNSGLGSTLAYDVTNNAVFAQVTPFTGGTSPLSWMQVQAAGPVNTTTAFLACAGCQYSAGNFQIFWANAAGTSTIVTTVTYNATSMAWWRIRESAGTLFFDTAPDGLTWTNQGSIADSTLAPYMNLQSMFLSFGGGTSVGSGNTVVQNVNIPGSSSNVTANAGLASATGTAQSPVALVQPNAGQPLGTGTAQSPVALVQPNAGQPLGTGTAQSPVAQETVPAGQALGTGTAQSAAVGDVVTTGDLAPGTGTAQSPSVSETVLAGLATGTGTAQSPGFSLAVGLASGTGTAQSPKPLVQPNAGQALGTGTAQSPSAADTVNAGLPAGTGGASQSPAPAGLAAATGTAQSPVALVQPNAGQALGTGTAQSPSAAETVFAGQALGTGTAFNATVTTSGTTTANAGLAAGTGTAQSPVALVQPNAGQALGTGTAWAPSVAETVFAGQALGTGTAQSPGFSLTVGLASGTGAAQSPAVQETVTAAVAAATGTALSAAVGDVVTTGDLAPGTGTAQPPSVQLTVFAGLAHATGTAQSPGFSLTAGLASGTGTAQSPSVAETVFAGQALGTGTAFNPSTGQSANVNAGLASGTGTAQPPLASITVFAGLAAATGVAQQPQVLRKPTGQSALSTGTAQSPGPSVTVFAGLAAATGTAQSPVTSRVVLAGLAHALAVAFNATGSQIRTPLHLGATVSYLNYGGTLTEASSGGSVVTVANLLGGGAVQVNAYSGSVTAKNTLLGGTASVLANTLGGSLNYNAFGGSLTGWTMQQTTLAISEFNDETINIAITNNGSPYNLTGVTVQMLFKTAAGTPDGSALVFSSTGGSPAITITNAAGGLATAIIPNADLNSEIYNFFRIDVVVSGLINTCLYGPITWTTL